jgi:hypothetical protein
VHPHKTSCKPMTFGCGATFSTILLMTSTSISLVSSASEMDSCFHIGRPLFNRFGVPIVAGPSLRRVFESVVKQRPGMPYFFQAVLEKNKIRKHSNNMKQHPSHKFIHANSAVVKVRSSAQIFRKATQISSAQIYAVVMVLR